MPPPFTSSDAGTSPMLQIAPSISIRPFVSHLEFMKFRAGKRLINGARPREIKGMLFVSVSAPENELPLSQMYLIKTVDKHNGWAQNCPLVLTSKL